MFGSGEDGAILWGADRHEEKGQTMYIILNIKIPLNCMRYTRKWVCRCGSVPVYQWRTGGEIYINLEKGVAHATKKWKEGNAKEMPRKGRKHKIKTNALQ